MQKVTIKKIWDAIKAIEDVKFWENSSTEWKEGYRRLEAENKRIKESRLTELNKYQWEEGMELNPKYVSYLTKTELAKAILSAQEKKGE